MKSKKRVSEERVKAKGTYAKNVGIRSNDNEVSHLSQKPKLKLEPSIADISLEHSKESSNGQERGEKKKEKQQRKDKL